MVTLRDLTTGFIFLVFINQAMSYKFLFGVTTGYILAHRNEFVQYREMIEPYTDPYLDTVFEKAKELKKTFEVAHQQVKKKEDNEEKKGWFKFN